MVVHVQPSPKSNDDSPILSKEEMKYVQAVAGTLLYYMRAVDTVILMALNLIAIKQAKPKQEMMKKVM